MRKSPGFRHILALTFVLAFIVGVLTLMPGARRVSAASNCTYYQNASYSTVVGRFGYDCCNNPVSWGRKTKYVICGGCFACEPPPR